MLAYACYASMSPCQLSSVKNGSINLDFQVDSCDRAIVNGSKSSLSYGSCFCLHCSFVVIGNHSYFKSKNEANDLFKLLIKKGL